MMKNFTVGPVMSDKQVLKIGGEQVPYFRTSEFSEIMKENERLMLKFSKAPKDAKVCFITGSGTASMEACIMNTLTQDDRVLVVNGGSFGERFVQMLKLHEIPYSEIKLEYGEELSIEHLCEYDSKDYTAFLVNVHETSTGVYYDINMISEFCQRNGMFLIVDAISSFLADPFDMEKLHVDVMITGSQKALACAPGISVIVLSPKALKRVGNSKVRCMYLDLKLALKDAERGQTPFTPAVSILRQINERLRNIDANGGVEQEIEKTKKMAEYFRSKIKELPLKIVSSSLSNAVTPLHPLNVSAYSVFTVLKDEYNIWICPNGGNMKDFVFRVGHIGSLKVKDYDALIDSLKDMQKRGLL